MRVNAFKVSVGRGSGKCRSVRSKLKKAGKKIIFLAVECSQ